MGFFDSFVGGLLGGDGEGGSKSSTSQTTAVEIANSQDVAQNIVFGDGGTGQNTLIVAGALVLLVLIVLVLGKR